jgi:hypothetical protein
MDFPELITFFANNRVAAIRSVPAYNTLCEKYADNLQFQRQNDLIEIAKTRIEKLLEDQPSSASQIRQAMIELQSQRNLDFDLYYKLIVAGYKSRWSAEQQKYFDRQIPAIRSGKDFFLSFTVREPQTIADKRINRRYRYYIDSVIGDNNIFPADRKSQNLMAKVLYIALTDKSLKGFYYPLHENDNAEVEQKLLAGCQNSRVFVQLVENVMFDPQKKPNFCEYEYRHAVQFIQEEDRILFVITEDSQDDLEDPATAYPDYRDWVEHIRSKAAPYLPPAESDTQRIDEIRKKVAEVVSQVKAARKSMLDRIPG